ncbi:MAG: hypothetical protein WDZ49_03035 [Litorilinea sp.]
MLSLLVACALLAACNAPPPPQPLELPVTLGFVDDDYGFRLVLSTTGYFNGGGAIAYAADVPDASGEAIGIELLGVSPCPTQYRPWPLRACPAAGMPATAEIGLDDLLYGSYTLLVAAGEAQDRLVLDISEYDIGLRFDTDNGVVMPNPAAADVANSPESPLAVPTLAPDSSQPTPIGQMPVLESYASLDGRWRVDVRTNDCASGTNPASHEELVLIHLADGLEYIADTQSINCGGLGAAGLAGLFWSENSRYFYYTDARAGVPDGCGYSAGPPFYRLEAEPLTTEYLGVGQISPNGTMLAVWNWQSTQLAIWDVEQGESIWMPSAAQMASQGPLAWSPDGTMLAAWQDHEFVLWNDAIGEVARIPAIAPGALPRDIVWSPDSRSLIYLQIVSDCPPLGPSYVVQVDALTGEQILHLESETPTFHAVRWRDGGELTLYADNSGEWRYNLETRELTLSEARHELEDGLPLTQGLQSLELPVTVGFLDDGRGLRMTFTTVPVGGGGNIAYHAEMPVAPGGEIRIRFQGLQLCLMGILACPDADLSAQAEIELDDLPVGQYTLLVSTENSQDRLQLDIGEYDIILRPVTENGVVVPNPHAAFVPNHLTRGDGMYQWRRLQPDTVWLQISYSGISGDQHPTARDRAEFWEQVAVVVEGLSAADDLEVLSMIEAFYAHPNFETLWPRYATPSQIQSTEAGIPDQVKYYRYTDTWDALVERVQSMLNSGIVSVRIHNFQGDVVSVSGHAQAVPAVSPLAPPP